MHGRLFGYDFVEDRPEPGGMAKVYAYVQEQREAWGDRLLLTDAGDVLQGDPTTACAAERPGGEAEMMGEAMNLMGYDAACPGNHDLGAGHAVYDAWVRRCRFPVLGANVVRTDNGQPYFAPYVVMERAGVRIAVVGLLTPVIPCWLPETLWGGLRFDDMTDCARRWVAHVRDTYRPHLVVGVLHSGREGGLIHNGRRENAAIHVAQQVEGFDLIGYGHDHLPHVEKVEGPGGSPVWCMAPAYQGLGVCVADIKLVLDGDTVREKCVSGGPTSLERRLEDAHSRRFEAHFADLRQAVEQYVNRSVGRGEEALQSRQAYFGSSGYLDLIHRVQRATLPADISLAAPVSFDVRIEKGTLAMRDAFRLYRYEDRLCILKLTGREIKGALERSYALWTEQMRGPDDHLLLLGDVLDGGRRKGLKNLTFNFESAAGVRYVVDVTKPVGERLHLSVLDDGRPFRLDEVYTVVTNTHRACGGGELLTRGAGLSPEELAERRIMCTEQTLRQCIVAYLLGHPSVDGRPLNNWHFEPEAWTGPAAKRDAVLLFGD